MIKKTYARFLEHRSYCFIVFSTYEWVFHYFGAALNSLRASSRFFGATLTLLGAGSRFFGAALTLLGADSHFFGAALNSFRADFPPQYYLAFLSGW